MMLNTISQLHVSGFPVAACVVQHKTQLAAVVQRLRASRVLRKGLNVTPFRVSIFEVVIPADNTNPTDGAEVAGLRLQRLTIVRRCCCCSGDDEDDAVEAWTRAGCSDFVAGLLQQQQQQPYFAVHVVGELSEPLLDELLVREDGERCGGGVVCIVTKLRLYSEAFCTAADLPSPLRALRVLATGCLLREGRSGTTAVAAGPQEVFQGFTFSELFAGIGMFRVGLERAGGRCVFAVENATPACLVYHANHDAKATEAAAAASASVSCGTPDLRPAPPPAFIGDITAVPSSFFPHHDVLTAGFPCQSFAKVGPGTGLLHEKGWLFFEVARVIRASRPKGFILENVENLLHVGHDTPQLDLILQILRAPAAAAASGATLSYVVECRVIDGALVTPQRRRRVYFLGVRADLPRATSQALNTALDAAVQQLEAYRQVHPEAPRCVRDVLEFAADAPQRDEHQLASLRLTEAQWESVQKSRTFRRCPVWRVADLDGVARTLMGSYRASYGLYSEFVPLLDCSPPMRFYSIRECARLQGIPEWFSFTTITTTTSSTAAAAGSLVSPGSNDDNDDGNGRNMQQCVIPLGAVYKLIGNAVNPIIVEHLGRALQSCLQQ